MKAMILAAGRGERLRPITDDCPKPLVKVAGKPLIVHHIERLSRAGFETVFVNTAWLGGQIEATLGDGSRFGIQIHYSHELERFGRALETAGGIIAIVDDLGPTPFLVVNGDIVCDFDFGSAFEIAQNLSENDRMAHLILVDNPPHRPEGDFFLSDSGIIATDKTNTGRSDRLTFSGIGVYSPALFGSATPGEPLRLPDLLRRPIDEGRVAGSRHRGLWIDIGTVDRLETARRLLER